MRLSSDIQKFISKFGQQRSEEDTAQWAIEFQKMVQIAVGMRPENTSLSKHIVDLRWTFTHHAQNLKFSLDALKQFSSVINRALYAAELNDQIDMLQAQRTGALKQIKNYTGKYQLDLQKNLVQKILEPLADSYYQLGQVSAEQGSDAFLKSITSYREILKYEPTNINAQQGMLTHHSAVTLDKIKDLPAILRTLEIDLQPENYGQHVYMGRTVKITRLQKTFNFLSQNAKHRCEKDRAHILYHQLRLKLEIQDKMWGKFSQRDINDLLNLNPAHFNSEENLFIASKLACVLGAPSDFSFYFGYQNPEAHAEKLQALEGWRCYKIILHLEAFVTAKLREPFAEDYTIEIKKHKTTQISTVKSSLFINYINHCVDVIANNLFAKALSVNPINGSSARDDFSPAQLLCNENDVLDIELSKKVIFAFVQHLPSDDDMTVVIGDFLTSQFFKALIKNRSNFNGIEFLLHCCAERARTSLGILFWIHIKIKTNNKVNSEKGAPLLAQLMREAQHYIKTNGYMEDEAARGLAEYLAFTQKEPYAFDLAFMSVIAVLINYRIESYMDVQDNGLFKNCIKPILSELSLCPDILTVLPAEYKEILLYRISTSFLALPVKTYSSDITKLAMLREDFEFYFKTFDLYGEQFAQSPIANIYGNLVRLTSGSSVSSVISMSSFKPETIESVNADISSPNVSAGSVPDFSDLDEHTTSPEMPRTVSRFSAWMKMDP